jgi:uncharacterized lipoprotein YbaY
MVDLVDISIDDIAVEPIASQVIAGARGPPFPFSLETAEDIDGRVMLAVTGRIMSAEPTCFGPPTPRRCSPIAPSRWS